MNTSPRFGRRSLEPLVLLSLSVLSAGPSARGELNKDEQAKVNQAIDKGVEFLKKQQLADGTWLAPDGKHIIGYATLPGLTLLESGVPADDPAIKKIAAVVRKSYLRNDKTYEIALSILFLDRLGDPNDKKIIQTLALRLVAGQKATGGWHYDCPLLPATLERELLTTLRALPALPPLMADQSGKIDTGADGVPVTISMPLLGTFSYKASPDEIPAGAVTNSPSSSSASGSDQGSMDASPNLKAAAWHLSRQNYCIKALEPAPAPVEPVRTAKDNKPARRVIIPANLQRMPIFIDPRKLAMFEDLAHKTDNSNTQFALLALWAAQRYDVPMDRTLRLLVRRFQVTQNANGGWDYWFFIGGGDKQADRGPGATPQMAAVGLLGLAVGHGLAAPARGAGPRGQAKDPTILKGFVALTNAIGQPTGRMQNIPQTPPLYFLWSLERVGVLYNLDRIGDKDWYRWGAEILVANQEPAGNWKDGKYPGASPVVDTCLALLFLQRANLAKDLADKLPFNPSDLNTAVSEQAKKDAAPVKSGRDLIAEKKPDPGPMSSPPMTTPPVTSEPKQVAEEKKEAIPAPAPASRTESSRSSSTTPAAEPEEKHKIWPYILLGVGGLMLVGFGLFMALYMRGGDDAEEDDEEDEEEERRPKRKLAKKH